MRCAVLICSCRIGAANIVCVGIAIVIVLMLLSVIRFPASLCESGLSYFVTTAAAFVVYGGAAAWVRSQTAERSQTAIAQGSWAGGFLAAVGLANLGVEHFVALGPAGEAIRGVGMWALMFLAFGFTGSAVYARVGSLGLGVVSSVWAAIISTVAMLVGGFSMSLLFMPHMRQILSDTFAHSNMTDPSAFVIYNTLSAAASHTILAPLIAAMFGFGGAITCQLLQSVQRRGGIALGICALVVLAVGLEAIRYASSLDRPQRPPYIMAGLLALGVTFACAHPIVCAVRRHTQTV